MKIIRCPFGSPCLWKIKLHLYCIRNNDLQAEICLALIIQQHDPYFHEIKRSDKKLEELLDRLIFRKYIWLSKRQSLKARRKAILKLIQKTNYIRRNQYDMIKFIHHKAWVSFSFEIFKTFIYLNLIKLGFIKLKFTHFLYVIKFLSCEGMIIQI